MCLARCAGTITLKQQSNLELGHHKKEGIINKVFVDMLDKLGYDIQLVYVKKKGAAEK